MAATLLFLLVGDFTVLQHGKPLQKLPIITRPSGIHSLRGARAVVQDRTHFQAWLREQQLTAVEDERLLPAVIVRGDPSVLARYGRVEAMRSPGQYRVHLGPGIVDPAEVARRLGGEPDEWLEMTTRQAMNDPLYGPLWHLHASQDAAAAPDANNRAEEAWAITKGTNTLIAITDDGFALTHPDLVDVFTAPRDFYDNDADPSPNSGDGHGTRVAGVAAARGNNAVGIVGVCPECRVIPIRVYTSGLGYDDAKLLGSASVVADAFRYAHAQGARIINASWGPSFNALSPTYRGPPAFVREAIGELTRDGVLFVWAAGNVGRMPVAFDGWANDPRVFAVGSLTASSRRGNDCVIGPGLALLAPSADAGTTLPAIITTDLDDDYRLNFNGTSAAAPQVAGAAALLLTAYPTLKVAQLMELLLDSAARVDVANAAYSRQRESCTHGAGRLDVKAALDLAAQRQAQYAGGHTLHLELCGDSLDNDGNPATSDTCNVCIPSASHEVADNGVDDDCDGNVDNAVPCVPRGRARCELCDEAAQCQPDFACLTRGDGKRCLRECSVNTSCAPGEQCESGACMPVRGAAPIECSAVNVCVPQGVETCDGLDNDCNGSVDDVGIDTQELASVLQQCRFNAVGVCLERSAKCINGSWTCEPSPLYKPIDDNCDGLDSNCNGHVDEGRACEEPPVPLEPIDEAPDKGCAQVPPFFYLTVLCAVVARRLRLPF